MNRNLRHGASLFGLVAASAVASAAIAQTPPPSQNPGGMTDQQVLNAANQVANGTPRGGIIPSPSDVAHGMNALSNPNGATLTTNPNAPLTGGTSITTATSTDFGQTAVGIGQPLVNNSQQVGQIIDEIQGAPGSQQYQAQLAQIRANQPPPNSYATVDQATGQVTWHPIPPTTDYSAQDAYMQQYMQNRATNGPPQVRDPFAQQGTATTTVSATTPSTPPQPTYQPQLPSGPGYPTYQGPKTTASQQATTTQADVNAIDTVLAAAMGAVAAAQAAAQASGDAGAVAGQDTTGVAAEAAEAGALAAQAAGDISQSLDAGCGNGSCGAYLAQPYDTSQWQPMPMFTEGQGNITDGGVNMTQVAQLLPIYAGYNPFATGNLVPWPGQMMFPTLYQPTGVSAAGLGYPLDPSLAQLNGYPALAGQWNAPSDVMTSLNLSPVLCGR